MSEFVDFDAELESLLGKDGYRELCRIVPHVRDKLESPLERMFVDGLEQVGFSAGRTGRAWRFEEFEITPQGRVDEYRCDFVVSDATDVWRFVVECDGHSYHERTAEQASRDRKRDRRLQSKGMAVLRFTGEELRSDRIACARQVLDFCRLKRSGQC